MVSQLARQPTDTETLFPIAKVSHQPDYIEDARKIAQTILVAEKQIAKDWFELGRLVVVSGLSNKDFANRLLVLGFGEAKLGYARRFYEQNKERPELPSVSSATELKELVRGRPFIENDRFTAVNPSLDIWTPYKWSMDNLYALCSALHKDIRDHEVLKAESKALMLCSMSPSTFWHQIRTIIATEDSTVPLAIVAVQLMYQTYLDEASRLPKKAPPTGDMLRMAMAAAKFLAQLPTDRTEDELLHIFAWSHDDKPTKEFWDSLTDLSDPRYHDMHTSTGRSNGRDYKDFVQSLPSEMITIDYGKLHPLYVKLLQNADFDLIKSFMTKFGWRPKG